MVTLRRLIFLFCVGFSLVAFLPDVTLAQDDDGLDNNGDGTIDEPGEVPGGSGGSGEMGRLEAVCNATAQIDACLASHNMFCQYFGLPQSCALADIGNNCNGGDPGMCRYYQDLMQVGMACNFGDQAACNWIYQQPVFANFR